MTLWECLVDSLSSSFSVTNSSRYMVSDDNFFLHERGVALMAGSMHKNWLEKDG